MCRSKEDVGNEGRSPRGRKNRNRASRAVALPGTTSAQAEGPIIRHGISPQCPGDLRVGGGTVVWHRITSDGWGRPPRRRRNDERLQVVIPRARTISAWAEEPSPRSWSCWIFRVDLPLSGGTSHDGEITFEATGRPPCGRRSRYRPGFCGRHSGSISACAEGRSFVMVSLCNVGATCAIREQRTRRDNLRAGGGS